MRIFLNLSYLWKSLFYENLFELFFFVRVAFFWKKKENCFDFFFLFVRISSSYGNLSFHESSFLSARIYFFSLSLYENKQAYQYHHLKRIFYHWKQIMILCRFRMFLFYALNSSHFMFEFLLLNKMSLNSLKSVVILTPFAILDSLPSIFFMEYIFDFNQLFFPQTRLSF